MESRPQEPSKGKILVIDDSQSVLESARLALEDAGYEVLTLRQALMSSAKIMRGRPDLVLVDVNMPTIDGDQLVEVVRRNESANDALLLLYSAKPPAELGALARRCGADGFISKSTDPESLPRQVNRWMARQRWNGPESSGAGA